MDHAVVRGSEGSEPTAQAEIVEKAQVLARGLHFSKRLFDARSLDEAYMLLTNDVRALLEFDRAFLIVHMGRTSEFAAANNLASLEKKSRFYRRVRALADNLLDLDQVVFVSRKDVHRISGKDFGTALREALVSYMEFSRCEHFLCLPLTHNDSPVAHLIFEFMGPRVPDRAEITALRNMGPFFGAALVQKWLMNKKPHLASLIPPLSRSGAGASAYVRYAALSAVAAFVLAVVLFLIPFDYTVGGEAEIVPMERHFAFCKIDGLIDRIYVVEGSPVKKDQILATLDPRELDHQINAAQREFEILTRQSTILAAASGNDPAKLAQAELVEIKRKKKWKELQYLKAQREYLQIRAPVDGIILTKEVETLSGKKLTAGEPFCEIAAQGDFGADIYVPEARITYVSTGQTATIYLNSNPSIGYGLRIEEIAPRAEALARLGNVYRVRAPFPDAAHSTMVGMKGIGKIVVAEVSLWFIIKQRLLTRWNQFSLYL